MPPTHPGLTADHYLQAILQREAVDTSLLSPVRGVEAILHPVIANWAGRALLSTTPSGSFAKETANQNGTHIDLFISLTSLSPDTMKEIYEKLFHKMLVAGYEPERRDVSIRVRVSDYAVDLVPAKRKSALESDHRLYHRPTDSWIRTNVAAHIGYVYQAGRMREIRILKLWRDQKRLYFPSFYL